MHSLGWLILALSVNMALIFAVISFEPALASLKKDLGIAQESTLPTLNDIRSGVTIYDRADHYLCTLHDSQDRQPVPLEKVSINMRNAVLAAEDHNFYNHFGIDPKGVIRAFRSNYEAGHVVQGGSTITQQLVRNLYLDKNDKSMKRKIKEAILAFEVDHNYSKAKILETYLNIVYFGGGVYGVERASQHYFNKHARDLSVPESAFLAGLICSPSVLGAPQNKELGIKRQQVVLDKMAEYGYIPSQNVDKLKEVKLAFKSGSNMVPYPYYVGYVMQELQRQLGDDMWKHGWKVYTNLDVPTQKMAEATLNRDIASAPKGIDQGALVSMSVNDGAVLAMVGGVGKYDNDPWNRALFPHTAGSSFKPFVYLAALIDGIIQPDTMIDDSPLDIDTGKYSPKYSPKNFDGRFDGWICARKALALSRNVCSARVALKEGLNRVIEVAHAAGIKSQLDPYPSLALGSCAVSPLDITNSYATLARGGVYMPPRLIRDIKSEDGKTEIKCEPAPSSNLPAEPVAQLVDVMQDVVRYGTGTLARLPGISVAGKTGTADSSKDIWFVGFTPDTVTAVWGGNDHNKAVSGKMVTGGTVMAHIWHDFMTSFYKMHKAPTGIAFKAPENKLVESAPQYSDVVAQREDSHTLKIVSRSEFGEQQELGGIARMKDFERVSELRRQRVMIATAPARRESRREPKPAASGNVDSDTKDAGDSPTRSSEDSVWWNQTF
jgi:penicillin-binding protein 1A